MLYFMGSRLIPDDEFIHLRLEKIPMGPFVVVLKTRGEEDIVISQSDNEKDVIDFMERICEKNASYLRYFNEKVAPPPLQLRPHGTENSQGVSGTPQPTVGSDGTTKCGGSDECSPVESCGSPALVDGAS